MAGHLRQSNPAENSHQPVRRREQKIKGLKSPGSAQRFSVLTPPFPMGLTCNATLFLAPRSACSGPRRLKCGRARPPRREAEDAGVDVRPLDHYRDVSVAPPTTAIKARTRRSTDGAFDIGAGLHPADSLNQLKSD